MYHAENGLAPLGTHECMRVRTVLGGKIENSTRGNFKKLEGMLRDAKTLKRKNRQRNPYRFLNGPRFSRWLSLLRYIVIDSSK